MKFSNLWNLVVSWYLYSLLNQYFSTFPKPYNSFLKEFLVIPYAQWQVSLILINFMNRLKIIENWWRNSNLQSVEIWMTLKMLAILPVVQLLYRESNQIMKSKRTMSSLNYSSNAGWMVGTCSRFNEPVFQDITVWLPLKAEFTTLLTILSFVVQLKNQ